MGRDRRNVAIVVAARRREAGQVLADIVEVMADLDQRSTRDDSSEDLPCPVQGGLQPGIERLEVLQALLQMGLSRIRDPYELGSLRLVPVGGVPEPAQPAGTDMRSHRRKVCGVLFFQRPCGCLQLALGFRARVLNPGENGATEALDGGHQIGSRNGLDRLDNRRLGGLRGIVDGDRRRNRTDLRGVHDQSAVLGEEVSRQCERRDGGTGESQVRGDAGPPRRTLRSSLHGLFGRSGRRGHESFVVAIVIARAVDPRVPQRGPGGFPAASVADSRGVKA